APSPSPLQPDWLRPLFEPGAWELRPPIIIENSQFTLLLGGYGNLPGGSVRLSPCTLIFFPDGRPQTLTPDARLLIMRAPEGAVLDFDQEIDLSRAETGRLKGGRLVGQVTIEGNLGPMDPKKEGGNHDLWMSTRDVELRADRIWTHQPVQFRLGPNQGQGRDMRMLLANGGLSNKGGLSDKTVVLRSFQLLHDVHFHAEADWDGLLPGKKTKAAQSVPTSEKTTEQVVDVRCKGRFRFDVDKLAANFEDQVEVIRALPGGKADQLQCDLLTIFLAMPEPGETRKTPKGGQKNRSLDVMQIQARGQPAVVKAASANAVIEGEYLDLDLRARRVLLSDPREVKVQYDTTQLFASQVKYFAGTSDDLGRLWATGPGRLRSGIPGPNGETIQATWRGQLHSRPHEGHQLVSLVDKVEVSSNQAGSLQSDEVWIWLRPSSGIVKADDEKPQTRYEPDRVMARGNVAINSTPLSGNVNQLEAWFQPVEKPKGETHLAAENGGIGSSKNLAAIKNHYHVQGETVRLKFGVLDRKPFLQNAAIDGNVDLVERTPAGDAEPLRVRGQQIQIQQADTPQATLSVTGQPAQVTARGLEIFGPSVHVSKADNKMWVDGAGKMTLPIDRDLDGKQLDQKHSLAVHWQNRMIFDGQTARFHDKIVASSQHHKLQTGQLDVILNQQVLFGQKSDQPIKMERIVCRGGVLLSSASFEQQRRTSVDRLQVADLSINQNTGDIQANGPGWIQTVRAGSNVQVAGGAQAAANNPRPAGAEKNDGLAYLKVRFERAITGNLHQRELRFGNQTRCIYGPVTDWSQELDLDKPGGPQGDEITLDCNELVLRQIGPERDNRRPIEMEAIGNATVEGETFTATGQRMTYTTAKDLLILQGEGATAAQLFHKKGSGASQSRAAADRILYWRATNRIKVEGWRFGTGTIDGEQPKIGPTTSRRKNP
ncbi:MAG: hypothetical protein WBF93_05025, partial [Pirellulales bacterium]